MPDPTDQLPVQLVARTSAIRPNIELVPPLADEFSVNGTGDVRARARDWALQHELLLVTGVPPCAHGLYGMGHCPGQCDKYRWADHANLWVPYDEPWRPFLLAHPYARDIPDDTAGYADAHGLRADRLTWDDWYSPGHTIPVRLTPKATDLTLWPLGTTAVLLLKVQPVTWPTER